MHLKDLRQYMPIEHRKIIQAINNYPTIKDKADKELFNDCLEGIAKFREVHIEWAQRYIQKHVKNNRGTGGTPYMQWLSQLITETRNYKIV